MVEKVKSLKKYSFLLAQLVRRDFKIRYRGSILGILWSVLNPLLNMIVLSIVFSQIFHAVENYKMYLLAGLTVFNFFSEATNLSCTSVALNFGLITKVYFPKIIIPTSKVLTSTINLLITTGVFFILALFMGMRLWLGDFLVLYVLICVLLFAMGVGYILSTLFVFSRDVQHLYGVILTIWMYATPILYPIESLKESLIPIFRCNPLFQFIDFFRKITMYNTMPGINHFLICGTWAIATFLIGVFVFTRNQDKFIYYA